MEPNNAITLARRLLASLRAMAVSILAAGLVACGGGGAPASTTPTTAPTSPVAITATNAPNITGAGFQAVTIGADATLLAAGVQTSSTTTTPNSRLLSELVAGIANILETQSSVSASVTGVVGTNVCANTGGTYTIAITSSTSGTITFVNCQLVLNGPIINGTASITNFVPNTSGTVSLNVTLTTAGVTKTITGGFSYTKASTATTSTVTLTGSGTTSLTITTGTRTDVLTSFSFVSVFTSATAIYTDTVSFTLSSTAIGGSVVFTTVTPFQTNAANIYPHTGVAHITSAAGPASLHITVLGNEAFVGYQVRIEVDLDGRLPITYESTVNTSWAALAAM